MNTITFAQQCRAYDVITSQGGRQLIEICPPHLLQALVTINRVPGVNFPGILKEAMVHIIRMMCDIQMSDSQTINAYQTKLHQLESRLVKAEAEAAARHEVKHQGRQGDPAKATQAANAAPKQKEVTGVDKECQISSHGINAEVQSGKEEDTSKGEETCIFFKRGVCSFGPTGTNGNGSCRFTHPPVCTRFDMFGAGKLGCRKGSKCLNGVHRTVCKQFINQKCNKGRSCGYYHPLGLRNKQEGKGPSLGKEANNDANSIILKLVKHWIASANKNCNGCSNKKPKKPKKN